MPGQRLEWFAKTHGAARRDGAVDDVEHAIGADRVERRLRAEENERLALAQGQKAGRRIDLGVGQDDGADRRMAPFALRMQRGRRQDLLAQIDRGVEQDPVLSVDAERDAHLRARLDPLSPLQASRQTRQPQFHCGTPPPAPEPSTSALSRG